MPLILQQAPAMISKQYNITSGSLWLDLYRAKLQASLSGTGRFLHPTNEDLFPPTSGKQSPAGGPEFAGPPVLHPTNEDLFAGTPVPMRQSRAMASLRKPVIVRKFSRDWCAGY